MSHLFRALTVAALASSTTLAQAQQPAQVLPAQPGQTQPAQTGRPGQGLPGQIQPGQGNVGQSATSRPMAMQGQGVPLTAFIAHELKRGNEAEVELGQLASQRAKTDSVKQFAQMMVQQHQQTIQQLEQFDQGVGGARGTRDATSNSPGRATNPGQTDSPNRTDSNSDRPRSNERNSESNTDDNQRNERTPSTGSSQASSGTGQSTQTADPAGQAGRGQAAGQPGAGQTISGQNPGQAAGQAGQNANQTGTSNTGINQGGLNPGGQAGRAMGGMSGHVPHMLVAIHDQACDNELQLTRQMLEKHEGEDFEMAYIGQQIVAHTCMLAKLQALKNSGPQELQQLVAQGEQTTRQHLDQAMKIAKELGEDKK